MSEVINVAFIAKPVAAPVAKPFIRHIGKCKCKRVFSVVARLKAVSYNVVPGYEGRKLNNKWAPLDIIFEREDGSVMAGTSACLIAPIVECDCGSDVNGKNPLIALRRVSFSMKEGHVCNASCTHSKGDVCVCSCGGLNHGAHFNLN